MKIVYIYLVSIYCVFGTVVKDSIEIKEYESNEVIVLDKKFELENNRDLNLLESTEELLESRNDVDFISRANFASEAVVRGYTQERLNVTIDGMRMFSACIDKMDPITSYIEIENIKHCEVNANKSDLSNGNSVGGGINFVTLKPSFGNGFGMTIDNQYKSSADYYISKGKADYSTEKIASLISYSIKRASNYSAGGNQPISNSQFGKENAKFNLKFLQSERAKHGVEYIYDHSFNVGYPALIMDTRETNMNMLSYTMNLKNLSSEVLNLDGKLYYNSISHLMDDYNRTDEEIDQRKVMPGMNMPMNGSTKTMGMNLKSKLLLGNDFLSLSYEAYSMSAFSDMKMSSINTEEEMYLVNLGDIITYSTGFSAAYLSSISETTFLKISGRLDYQRRKLTNDFAKAITQSYWGGQYSKTNIILNSSIGINHTLDENTELGITLARSERAPSHIEQYGFYIYNVADNSIYVGDPNLKKEKSFSINLNYKLNIGKTQIEVDAFDDYLTDYIAGLLDDGVDVSQGFGQQFKQFGNIGNANIFGVGAKFNYQFSTELFFSAKTKFQYSHSFMFNEPLPFTPPLSGSMGLNYSNSDYTGVVFAEFASEQSNISRSISQEDITPSYVILNFRSSYAISEHFKLKFGVDNLLDRYYYTHFSINNLPSQGRNIYLGIVFDIE